MRASSNLACSGMFRLVIGWFQMYFQKPVQKGSPVRCLSAAASMLLTCSSKPRVAGRTWMRADWYCSSMGDMYACTSRSAAVS